MMRSLRLAGLMLLMGTGMAAAQDFPAAAPIASLDAGLLAAMHAGAATPFAQRYQALAPIVTNAFDLQAILKSAVGLRWQQIAPDQQAALLAAFTRFTVSTYVANFDSFGGEAIDITGSRDAGGDRIVQTQIRPVHGDPARIDYVMRQEDGRWRAVDVLLDGNISRAAVSRSDFRGLLASGGAAALAADLNGKADTLAAKSGRGS